MRRHLALFACLSTAALACASPVFAQPSYEQTYAAESMPMANVPLVVIRFNQNKVLFERQLYNAVAKAVQIKPTVVFDIVSFVPQTGNGRTDEKIAAKASGQTSSVVNALRGMGIPQERMHVSQEASSGLQYHEVHVYVE